MVRIFIASLFILGQVLVSFSLVPLYITARGGTTFDVGVQTTVFAVASVVLRFIFGPMADTRGRRFVLAVGAFVFASSNLLILYAPSLSWMIVIRVYQAIGMASYLSSASSFVADLSPPEHRGSAIGAYRMILPFASLVGPFLGNDIINRFGFHVFFVAMAGASFVSFFVILSLRGGRRPPVGGVSRVRLRDFVAIVQIPEVRAAYLAILLISIGGGIINTFITGYGAPHFRNPASYFIVYAAVGALGAFFLGRISDAVGRPRLVPVVLISMGIGMIVLPVIPRAPIVVYTMSAIGTGLGFNAGLSILISWIVDNIPDYRRATALSLQESWIDGGFAVGIFLFGSLSIAAGQGTLFLVVGAAIAAGTFLVLFVAHREGEE